MVQKVPFHGAPPTAIHLFAIYVEYTHKPDT